MPYKNKYIALASTSLMLSKVEVIGESVEFIYCACNCGKTRSKYDSHDRIRQFINNHDKRVRKFTEEHRKKIGDKHRGKIITEETRKKTSESLKGRYLNEKNRFWKGDDVSYRALHGWIRRHLPKPKDDMCMLCQQNQFKEVACITSIYNREFKNWAWFCHKCHCKWDNLGTRNKIKNLEREYD
jgi:hypothetical protein